MKKLLLVLMLVALGAAFAQSNLSFAFDDKDFTYFGSEEGYLSLALEEDKFVFHLSDEPTGMKLSFDEIDTPNYAGNDGDDEDWEESDYRKDPNKRITLARLVRCDVARNRAEVSHKNARLNSVIEVYGEALNTLGFEPETNLVRGTARDYTFVRGDQRLQVSFSRVFDEGDRLVKVRMTTL